MAKELWIEKYRPKNLSGYVFRDLQQKKQIERWISEKSIPHLLFSGNAGIGKTTLARLLCNELSVLDYDLLEINASRSNSVDDVRDTIFKFLATIPFGNIKIVILDEADYLSPSAQAALRGILEEYHEIARFILTCNYPNRIIPAIHSRCQGFHIEKTDINEFTARVATILIQESIEFELDALDTFVKSTYPDLRKCINNIQMHSIDGSLKLPATADYAESDYKIRMVELFKAGKISDARKLICSQIRPEEIPDIYKWLYNNIQIFGDEHIQEDAILIVKQGLVDHTLCIDPEINLSATLIRLGHLKPRTQ